MSKITNYDLTWSSRACFIAVIIMATVVVKGLTPGRPQFTTVNAERPPRWGDADSLIFCRCSP